MKRRFLTFALTGFMLIGFISMVGCAVPGAYMNPQQVTQSHDVYGKLMDAHLYPIESAPHSNFVPQPYLIGSHDMLNIVVWDHPELTAPMMRVSSDDSDNVLPSDVSQLASKSVSGTEVNSDGYIYFPYVGNLKVAGLSTTQARKLITKRLAKYIRSPQISLNVSAFRHSSVYAMGELVRPGTQSITNRPLTLLGAINKAGGINPLTADAGHIYVIRGNTAHYQVYWLSAKSPQAMLYAERFYLRSGDLVYVAPAKVSSWNKVVAEILPTVQTIWYTKSLVNG